MQHDSRGFCGPVTAILGAVSPSPVLLRRLLAGLTLLVLSTGLAAGQALTITDVTPAAGEPGDLFVVTGSGFSPIAENNAVSLSDGTTGTVAEVLSASEDTLLCRLDAVDPAFTGAVRVAVGQRQHLEDSILDLGNRAYLITDASWLGSTAAASGSSFQALASQGSPCIAAAQNTSYGLTFMLKECGWMPSTILVRLDIETCAHKPLLEHPSSAMAMVVLPGSDSNQAIEDLAADIATGLNQTFGPFGIAASTVGNKVIVHLLRCENEPARGVGTFAFAP